MNDGGSPATIYLLDTSAVLTLLEDEAGADRVQQILRSGQVLLPFVVPLEVFYVSVQERGERLGHVRYGMLKALRVVHVNEVTEPVVLMAGRFKARYPISLADALIAAFARCHDAVLVHKDPDYEVLREGLRLESLPYKVVRR